ncbi:unnamed protein product [Mytilus coruscus]|uniref:Uncharacterized protein n=1 Tax=Mytilus coruscus TaxID=42192 RepID=A0A6J8BL85_MYTCO|nr:unnamed protein product [Mytilus coruscus]
MEQTDTTSNFTTIDDALDVVSKCKTFIETLYRLLRHKASEVLVFLLSALDRMSESEMEHAVPNAFALKGYSMSTNIMRKMLKDVSKRDCMCQLFRLTINGTICVSDQTRRTNDTSSASKRRFQEIKGKNKNFHLTGKNILSNTTMDGDCLMLNTSDRDLEDHIFSVIPNDDVDKIDNRLIVEFEQLNESICLQLQQEERVTLSSTDVITDDSFAPVNRTEDHSSLHEISQTLDNKNQSNSSKMCFV